MKFELNHIYLTSRHWTINKLKIVEETKKCYWFSFFNWTELSKHISYEEKEVLERLYIIKEDLGQDIQSELWKDGMKMPDWLKPEN